jgi:hypothetical protein
LSARAKGRGTPNLPEHITLACTIGKKNIRITSRYQRASNLKDKNGSRVGLRIQSQRASKSYRGRKAVNTRDQSQPTQVCRKIIRHGARFVPKIREGGSGGSLSLPRKGVSCMD